MNTVSSKSICIIGPTSAGKTGVAIEVAKHLGGEVIGLDSRQIYYHMTVGTAQPSNQEREGIPHHLYSIRDPAQLISAGEYSHLVEEKIEEIKSRGNLPIICGGSGLYFRALTKGIFEDSTTDLKVRKKLIRRLEKEGAEVLLAELKKVDPEYAEIVHPNNHKRLIRALEILEATGLPPTEHYRHQEEVRSDFVSLFVTYLRPEMEWLEDRIRHRTDEMLAAGWVDEVKALLEMGIPRDAHPMDSVGYHEIMTHLDGGMKYGEMVSQINLKTRQYAKKQFTWFNKEKVDYVYQISNDKDLREAPIHIEQMYRNSH